MTVLANSFVARSVGRLAIVLAAVSGCASDEQAGSDVPTRGHWTSLASSRAVLRFRSGGASAWTGTELLVWGGTGYCEGELFGRCGDGARYDPRSDQWRPITATGAPTPRDFAATVWTGSELVVWGGAGCGDHLSSCADGASYDPSTDRWSPTDASAGIGGRHAALATWTGREMLVWGGFHLAGPLTSESVALDGGGAFDPSTRTWRTISRNSAPSTRMHASGVWTGREWVVFGGESPAGQGAVPDRGYAYDPALDSWRRITDVGAPSPRWGALAVWTGAEVIVWGGNLPGGGANRAGDSAAYDPRADRWRPIPAAPRNQVGSGLAVWTGTLLVLLASEETLLDPTTGEWWRFATEGAPSAGVTGLVAWTGGELIVWGGYHSHEGIAVEGGGRFVP